MGDGRPSMLGAAAASASACFPLWPGHARSFGMLSADQWNYISPPSTGPPGSGHAGDSQVRAALQSSGLPEEAAQDDAVFYAYASAPYAYGRSARAERTGRGAGAGTEALAVLT